MKFHLLPNFGAEIKAYADAIGKTISVIITHNHADHWGNIDHFASSKIYADENVATELEAETEFTKLFSGTINKIKTSETIESLVYKIGSISNSRTHKKRQIEQKQWQIKMKDLYRI